MEPIPELNKNFARIQIVGCAKGEAVVEQDPAIGISRDQTWGVRRALLNRFAYSLYFWRTMKWLMSSPCCINIAIREFGSAEVRSKLMPAE